MTSILKTDEIQSQNGGSVVKIQTLKHPSASGNNLTLTASGGIKVPDGGNIGSASDPDAMSISSVGIITKSNLPHFSAHGSGGQTEITASARIPFTQTASNIGSHFSTSNNEYWFLTPVAGIYIFEVSMYAYEPGSNSYDFEIVSTNTSNADELALTRVANVNLAQAQFIGGQCVQYVPASRRISVVNKTGSEIDVYLTNNGRHTRFSGCLIG